MPTPKTMQIILRSLSVTVAVCYAGIIAELALVLDVGEAVAGLGSEIDRFMARYCSLSLSSSSFVTNVLAPLHRVMPWFFVVFVVTLLVLIVFGLAVSFHLTRLRWDRRGRFRWAGVLAALGYLVFLRWDCPPAAKQFTFADMPQPPHHEAESRAAQLPLVRHASCPPVQASVCPVQDVWPLGTNIRGILAHSNEIEQAWLASSNWFALQTTLASFDGIADVATNAFGPQLAYLDQRRSAQFLVMYAMLKARQGNAEEAVRVLAVQNAVVRKAMPYAGTLVGKMIWIAILGLNNSAAYDIANDTNTPLAVVRTMKDAFPPFSHSTIAFAGCITGEMVSATAWVDLTLAHPSVLGGLGVISSSGEHLKPGMTTRFFLPFLFNRNRTLRDCHRILDPVLASVAKVPMECTNMEPVIVQYEKQLPVRNVLGWCLVRSVMPNCMEAIRRTNERKALSDLLAIRIRQRLGEPIEIMDCFSGTSYLIDTNGIPFSAGPDKIPWTTDDIRFKDIR